MHQPIEIKLQQKSRKLVITFNTGETFELPCEYLRVYSQSAEVTGHGPGQEVLQVGKQNVNIDAITPVGNYAVKLHFDDGHDTGIYSWETLYDLGKNYDSYWQSYLQKLLAAGHKHPEMETHVSDLL
jgi:DUF971 family protein